MPRSLHLTSSSSRQMAHQRRAALEIARAGDFFQVRLNNKGGIFHVWKRMAPALVVAFTGAALLGVSGCKGAAVPPPAQRADYTETLNKYYEGRPLCLWDEPVKFPLEGVTAEQADDLGLDGLADAGLLSARGRRGPGTRTFELTPEGRSAFNKDIFTPGAGNFCYGRRSVVSVDKARRNSSTTELVDFQYAVLDPAAWARESSIQNAFPQVAGELAGPHAAEVTLLDTTAGWEVSGTPSTTIPRPTRAHGSPLAQMLRLKKP